MDVDLYLGSRFVKRCGTLVQGHGLRQQDQVYRYRTLDWSMILFILLILLSPTLADSAG